MELTDRSDTLWADELEVRPGERLAVVAGRALPLSVRELELLAALVRRRGHVVARAELYELVWGAPLRRDDRSVDVYVHKLRAKLASVVPERSFIHTHFWFGYRLEPEPSHPFHKGAPDQDQDGAR
jgi:DNA-binding response OmpR family regulator